MKFPISTLALLATARTPITTKAWSFGLTPYRRMRLMSPAWDLLQEQQALTDRVFRHTSPRYEITDNDEMFQVAVDVPGVKIEDLTVNVQDDVLSISGSREASREGYNFTSKFSQSFSIDPSVDMSKFTADLQNGVLLIKAPKDVKKLEERVRAIPIRMVEPGKEEKPVEIGTHESAQPVEVKHEREEAASSKA